MHANHQSQIAGEALAFFGQLYGVEREVAELDDEARWRLRQEKAKPILDLLHPVSAVQTMSKMASDAAKSMTPGSIEQAPAPDPAPSAFSEASMWPWQMMQQMREQMQQTTEAATHASNEEGATERTSRRRSKN